jgi:prepilin-type N-terminal cleavage/methylation domain-containing protein
VAPRPRGAEKSRWGEKSPRVKTQYKCKPGEDFDVRLSTARISSGSRAGRGDGVMLEAAGFTLIEVMIALMVMTFGLLTAGQMIYVAASAASLARSKGSAALVAQDRLHLLADLYVSNPDMGDLADGSHGPEFVEIIGPDTQAVLNRFGVSWTVSQVPDPRPGKVLNARLVTVTVTPVDGKNAPNLRTALNKAVTISVIFSGRVS